MKPKGGRGQRAPYKTTHLRVPEPIKDDLQRLIDQWRDKYMQGENSQLIPEQSQVDLSRAIELLGEGLTLKPNAGGAIKGKIREAMAVLSLGTTTTTTHTASHYSHKEGSGENDG
jgi:hypothetical protein